MDHNNVDDPIKWLGSRGGRRKIPLRMFVGGVVSAALATFTWQRTAGDFLISALVAALAVAVVDLRVSDSDNM